MFNFFNLFTTLTIFISLACLAKAETCTIAWDMNSKICQTKFRVWKCDHCNTAGVLKPDISIFSYKIDPDKRTNFVTYPYTITYPTPDHEPLYHREDARSVPFTGVRLAECEQCL